MSYEYQVETSAHGQKVVTASWILQSNTLPISNATEITALQNELDGLPIPEMPFGGNSLIIRHINSGFEYSFSTLEALRHVKLGELEPGDGGVQVGYAKEWLQSRMTPSSTNPMPKVVQAKQYDWTYTTTYCGHISSQKPEVGSFKLADPSNPTHRIPVEELSRPDPIWFYAEFPLFEDELHDNGSAIFTVRARMMPKSFFVLTRFCLRVDTVLFRIFDTRLFHSFASSPPLIVRQTSGWEAPYETIKKFLPTPDLSPLANPDFVHRAITSLPASETQNPSKGAETGWRGLGSCTEVFELQSSAP